MTSLGAGALNWRMDLQIAFDSVKFSLINMTSIHLGPASQSADVVITLLIADSSYFVYLLYINEDFYFQNV